MSKARQLAQKPSQPTGKLEASETKIEALEARIETLENDNE